MSRVWAMPNAETFTIPPIRAFVLRHLRGVVIDPFARNQKFAQYTNDLNPDTEAESHEDAERFLVGLAERGVRGDVVLFDPPYSPRQISECYASVGVRCGAEETQNARLYKRVRQAIRGVVADNGTVLSFGWNSAGMGDGFEIEELLLVAHGGAHNDTICMAERRIQPSLFGNRE